MNNLVDFLVVDYASHFGVKWNHGTMTVRQETPSSICFEIEDKKETIVQPSGQGVSVIRRTAESVDIVDLEDFTKQIHGEEDTPSSCDFAIVPSTGTNFLLLNELTRARSEYILRFTQPTTGIEQEGKLEKARKQLTATIDRFYEVSNFCDQYASRVALFSCRLSDKKKSGVMAKSAKAFNKGIYKLQKMRLHEMLPHGFGFKMRVYNEEYKVG